MDIKNGTVVKMIAGDRDRVGEHSFVEQINSETGNCEFHGICDYCHGNINEIITEEQYKEPNCFEKYRRASYVLVSTPPAHMTQSRRRFS